MKLTGNQILGLLKNYFGSGEASSSSEIFFYLILPGILLAIFVLVYSWWLNGERDDIEEADNKQLSKEDNTELIDSIRLQKGLEIYDLDFLKKQSKNYGIDIVKILLDKEEFTRLEHRIYDEVTEAKRVPADDKVLKQLKKLKSKLF